MANVIHRTDAPVDFRVSVHTPDFTEPTWLADPDLSGVSGVALKYWNPPGAAGAGPTEMSQPEKDAVDAALAAAVVTDNRGIAVATPDDTEAAVGWQTRALIELLNKRDNFNTNRIIELQNVVHALITDGAFAASKVAAEAQRSGGAFLATQTRTRADAVQDYKDEINSGGADT